MIFLALSHDVDRTKKTFQYITHLLKVRNIKQLQYQLKSIFDKNHYWGFDRIINLENKYNVKSTFFILNESIPFKLIQPSNWKLSVGYYNIFDEKIQNMIKYLDANGWEIGLHGSYLSYEDTDLLIKEKEDLESIIGHKIFGVRQHFLNLDKSTWYRQKLVGFTYDASFGFTRNVGFKEGIYHPFTPGGMSDFQVVPLTIMDFCLMKFQDPFLKACEIIDETEKNDAILVLNWHQRTFNTNEFPDYFQLYERILVECINRNATIGPINYILNKLNTKNA